MTALPPAAKESGHLLMTADTVGGVWQYASDLARGLVRYGWRTTLAVLGPSPSPAQRTAALTIPGLTLIDTGLPIDWLAKGEKDVLRAGAELADIAAEAAVDLVQLNAPAFGASARFSAPVVAVTHSCLASWWSAVKQEPIDRDYRWQAKLTGAGLAAADRVVAPSASFAEATMRAYDLPTRPMVVHNGRPPLTRPAAAMHDFCFTAGRLWDKAKDVATLDEVAGRLAVPFRAAGPLKAQNGEAAPPLAHLHALGSIDESEIGRWLACRPVFVSASLYEPFGLAVLEAAAAGCPLVLADIPTFRELWDGAATFVEPRDVKGFAQACDAIVGDVALRLTLGEAARQRAARYTPAAMAAGMAAIYHSLDVGGLGKDMTDGKVAAA